MACHPTSDRLVDLTEDLPVGTERAASLEIESPCEEADQCAEINRLEAFIWIPESVLCRTYKGRCWVPMVIATEDSGLEGKSQRPGPGASFADCVLVLGTGLGPGGGRNGRSARRKTRQI
jgi:hypothetical protein